MTTTARHLRSSSDDSGERPPDNPLEVFLRTHSDRAFEQIVRRFGPIVLGICRSVLGNPHDADEAFQTTFLVLARNARSIRKPGSLGSWLCGVAHRVAVRAKARVDRNRIREQRLSAMQSKTPPAESDSKDSALEPPDVMMPPPEIASQREDVAMLSEELALLPNKYRAPLMLCYIEGQTTEMAAQELRCPVGTVRSRLIKGRRILLDRLTRRGMVFSAAGLVLFLQQGFLKADVPATLTESAVRGSMASLNGSAAAFSPTVSELADEVTYWIHASTLQTTLLVGLFLGFGLLGGFWWYNSESSTSDVVSTNPPIHAKEVRQPIDQSTGTLLVVHQRDSTVAVIDLATNQIRSKVFVGVCPHEVAVSPDGQTAVIASYGYPFSQDPGNSLTVIDVQQGKLLRHIDLEQHIMPHGLAWIDDRYFLCTSEKAKTLLEIDAESGKIIRELPTNQLGTHMVQVAPNLRRAFATNVFSETMTAFDLNTGERLFHLYAGKGAEGIAISPKEKQVWVANRLSKSISVFDAERLRSVTTLDLPGSPFRLCFSPDGKMVLTTLHEGMVILHDAETFREKKRIKLTDSKLITETGNQPIYPAAAVFDPNGRLAYCSVYSGKAVAVIDLNKGQVINTIPVGENPDGIAYSPVIGP